MTALSEYVRKYHARKAAETMLERFTMAATMPILTHRVGETKSIGGVTYRLNENHRWERADHDASTPQATPAQTQPTQAMTPPPAPGAPAQAEQQGQQQQPKERWKGGPPGDHKARHTFTKQAMGQVQGPAKGLMAALHASPEVQNGGEYATKSIPDAHAKGIADWLHQNAGQQVAGGRVVDLGQGRLGFSSPAGALVVWPPDKTGKRKVGYTNKTGIVNQAMGGGQPGAEPQAPPVQSPPVQAQPAPQAGPQQPPQQPPQQAATQPATQPQQAVQPGFEPSKATPEQAKAAGALTEQPKKPEPPPEPKTPREAADRAKADHAAAVDMWRKEAPGLTPKGNARWRSYTAALRTIAKEKEAAARTHERGGAKGKPTAAAGEEPDETGRLEAAVEAKSPEMLKQAQEFAKGGMDKDVYHNILKQLIGDDDVKPEDKQRPGPGGKEADAMARLGINTGGEHQTGRQMIDKERARQAGGVDPDTGLPSRPLLDKPQGQTQGQQKRPLTRQWKAGYNTGSVEFADENHRDLHDLGAKMRRSVTARNFPEHERRAMGILRDSLAKRTGMKPEEISSMAAEVHRENSKQMKGIGEGEHRKLKMAGGSMLKETPGGGEVPTPSGEAMERLKMPKRQRRLLDMARQHFEKHGIEGSEHNRKAIEDAVKKGRIKTPRAVRGVARTAAKLHQRAGKQGEDHAHVKEAIRRQANREGRESYQAIVKKQAAAWDMKPEEYHSVAKELFNEYAQTHETREAAKAHARKLTGLTSKKIHELEHSGKDHSSHPKLDVWGEEVASQFGDLGWHDNHDERLWNLIKEGSQKTPSRAGAGFHEYIDNYLQQQIRSTGTGGSKAADDDVSAVPFTLRAWLERFTLPSEAQREAGNYKKRHLRMHGLDISIENEKGTRRRPEWPPLSAAYGYIRGYKDRDGDHVDVFVGPDKESEIVFVIDQVTEAGRFDEHKCILGTNSEEEAKATYLANYTKGWKCGPITAMTIDQFKEWLASGDTTKRVAAQVSKFTASYQRLIEADMARMGAC